ASAAAAHRTCDLGKWAHRTCDLGRWCPWRARKARREPGGGVMNPRIAQRCPLSLPGRADSHDLAALRTERCVAAPVGELRRTRASAVRRRLWDSAAVALA